MIRLYQKNEGGGFQVDNILDQVYTYVFIEENL